MATSAELLLDTSAAVALLLEDHELHAAAVGRVDGARIGLAGHAAFETYSVLTRLPPPDRLSATRAAALILESFPFTVALTPVAADAGLLVEWASHGIAGGSVYDALVALAATRADRPLLSADRRAVPTYRQVGAAVELIER